jgi:hypothetical protein
MKTVTENILLPEDVTYQITGTPKEEFLKGL